MKEDSLKKKLAMGEEAFQKRLANRLEVVKRIINELLSGNEIIFDNAEIDDKIAINEDNVELTEIANKKYSVSKRGIVEENLTYGDGSVLKFTGKTAVFHMLELLNNIENSELEISRHKKKIEIPEDLQNQLREYILNIEEKIQEIARKSYSSYDKTYSLIMQDAYNKVSFDTTIMPMATRSNELTYIDDQRR